jgi:23S rRNA pseudouridine2605 synthase
VLVARRPDEQQLETWRRGVVLEDGYKTAPAEVRVEAPFGRGAWLRVVLKEGRKRQIRETGRLLGLPVVKIIRVRIGTLYLGNLKPREWRHLTVDEIPTLKGKPGKARLRPKKARPEPKKSGGFSKPGRAPEKGKRR